MQALGGIVDTKMHEKGIAKQMGRWKEHGKFHRMKIKQNTVEK